MFSSLTKECAFIKNNIFLIMIILTVNSKHQCACTFILCRMLSIVVYRPCICFRLCRVLIATLFLFSHNYQIPEHKISKYTVSYFTSIGRGEPIPLMFVVAGVEFTDNLVSIQEWPNIKHDSKLKFIKHSLTFSRLS